jgi:hypothetical protein
VADPAGKAKVAHRWRILTNYHNRDKCTMINVAPEAGLPFTLYSRFNCMKPLVLSLVACLLAAGAEIPRKAYDVPIMLPDGTKLNVSEYRGKVVCLAFILTT